jgi:hypothetical protein
MFSLRLHPSRSGFLFGVALVAFWALLWLWFLAQLPRTTESGDDLTPAVVSILTARSTETAAGPR